VNIEFDQLHSNEVSIPIVNGNLIARLSLSALLAGGAVAGV